MSSKWKKDRRRMDYEQGLALEQMKVGQGYALEQMELQNKYNIEAFTRENEYNSPINQKSRMEQAGLNPNWSDISGNTGEMSSSVSGSSPGSNAPHSDEQDMLPQYLGLIKDVAGASSEIMNSITSRKAQKSQEAVNISAAAKNYADAQKSMADADISLQQYPWIDKLNQNTLNTGSSQRDLWYSQQQMIYQQEQYFNQLATYWRNNQDNMTNEILSRITKNKDEADFLRAKVPEILQSISESKTRQHKMRNDEQVAWASVNIEGKKVAVSQHMAETMRRSQISHSKYESTLGQIQQGFFDISKEKWDNSQDAFKMQHQYLTKYYDTLIKNDFPVHVARDMQSQLYWNTFTRFREYEHLGKINAMMQQQMDYFVWDEAMKIYTGMNERAGAAAGAYYGNSIKPQAPSESPSIPVQNVPEFNSWSIW